MIGNSYILTVQAGYSGTYVNVYIDYNQNNTFDATELIGQINCSASGNNYSLSFTVPGTALSGNTRIRALTEWMGYPSGPCTSQTYGNCSDFTVNLISSVLPPTVTTIAATSILATSATVNSAVNANGYSTTTSFQYGLTIAYGLSVAGVPVTVTGNTATAVSANISGLTPNTLYHFRGVGVSSGGTTNGSDMTFTTPNCLVPSAPGSISGLISVCQNQPGVSYSIAAVPHATNYNWTVPAGATISGGVGTNSITVNFSNSAVSGNITVTPTNSCSTGPTGTLAVTVNTLPVPTISGPANVCVQSANNVYTTQGGMTAYNWTVSSGGILTSGAGTSSITVTWNTSGSKTITVNYVNANGCSAANPGSFNVTVNALPVPTITGITGVCLNSGYLDYYTQAGQTNYVWTISSGGSIIYGAGTYHVTVNWAVTGTQTLSVNYSTTAGCSAASPSVLQVTVNTVPNAAGPITGSSSVCTGATEVAYSVGAVPNASSYVWTLPTGASIASGAGTNSIIVNFSSTAASGNILVAGNNVCGNGQNSPQFPVTVNQAPGAAGTITGQTSVCQNDMASYYVTAVPNTTGYTWSLPPGASINSGDNTTFIEVSFNSSAASGNVSVVPTNSCGNGTASPNFAVTVNTTPADPVITLNGSVISSNSTSGNQWYRNLTFIQGATQQHITPTESGIYTDKVTLGGCSSGMSNSIYYLPTIIGENKGSELKVYPNPGNGVFTVEIPSSITGNCDIWVFNDLGVMMLEMKNLSGTITKTIDLRPVAAGVYLIELKSSDCRLLKRVVIN